MTTIRLSASAGNLQRANYLTPIRWVLASAVMIAHAYEISGERDPLGVYNFQASDLAVNAFFILSGILIAKSLNDRNNWVQFVESRFLRIVPAMALVLLAIIISLGPLYAHPAGMSFYQNPETWDYIRRVLFLGDPRGLYSGVFEGNHQAHINAPLWTIRFEIFCYFLFALLFFIGIVRHKKSAILVCLVLNAVSIGRYIFPFFQEYLFISDFFRLSAAFSLGVAAYYYLPRLPIKLPIVITLSLLFLLLGKTQLGEVSANLALLWGMLYIGLLNVNVQALKKVPDFSFGIYIWHYPIMQLIEHSNSLHSPRILLAISIPIVLFLAAFSWYIVEKPALRYKGKLFSNFIQS